MKKIRNLIKKEKSPNGRRRIYLCGIKILSYKRKRKNKSSNFDFNKILEIQSLYKTQEDNIQKKLSSNIPLKVAFLVTLPSMFPAKPLMEKMCKDPAFNVSIIVIPDFRFGLARAKESSKQCADELADFKDHLYVAPMKEKNDKIDLKSLADIIFHPFCYDVSHPKYNLINMIQLGILPVLVNYATYNTIYDRYNLISSNQFALFWKIFVDEKYSLKEFQEFSLLKGKNAVLAGYCKMDNYQNIPHSSKQKTIIIAPHHSIKGGFNDIIQLSNFLEYADLFLKLPDMYPEIHFIFRPHPALLPVLEQDTFWGKEKTDGYMEQMAQKANVTISLTGDYFKEFAISDGIIQDCASFLTEYFWTKKPQCYLLKTPEDIDKKFIPLGKACLEHCYVGYNEKDILNFIDNVIIKGNDPQKEEREKFTENEVMLNYPNASEKIISYLRRYFK